jgi:hypothetical protein
VSAIRSSLVPSGLVVVGFLRGCTGKVVADQRCHAHDAGGEERHLGWVFGEERDNAGRAERDAHDLPGDDGSLLALR